MPLDPQVSQLLRAIDSAGWTSFSKLSVKEVRDAFARLTSFIPREDVKSIQDFQIPVEGGAISARLYTPPALHTNGVVLYFHGGGFVIGGIEEYDGLCRALSSLCETRVVSVGYRLAPEYRFPTAVDDCYASLKYLFNHSSELGIDSSKFVVAGDSAGGNLAAVVSLQSRGKFVLKRQVLLYPVVTADSATKSLVEYSDGYFLTREQMGWFSSKYARSKQDFFDPRFSPLLEDSLRGAPPTLVVTAEYDPLRDQGEAYASRLAAEGVPVMNMRVNGMVHSFLSFFGNVGAGRDALAAIAGVIRQDLR